MAPLALWRWLNSGFATYCRWKFKCTDVAVSDMKRERELKAESAKLKRMKWLSGLLFDRKWFAKAGGQLGNFGLWIRQHLFVV